MFATAIPVPRRPRISWGLLLIVLLTPAVVSPPAAVAQPNYPTCGVVGCALGPFS